MELFCAICFSAFNLSLKDAASSKFLSFDAKIISHNEDKKILVYKKKRRKGYEKKLGHKQKFSVIKVDKLLTKKTTTTKTKKKTNSSTSAAKKKTVAKKSTKSK